MTLRFGLSCVSLLALAVPATFAISALLRLRPTSHRPSALPASVVAFTAALLFSLGALLQRAAHVDAAHLGVRVDVVTCLMLMLVVTLGVVIERYSRTYLGSDPGFPRYQRWLLLTLSFVTALVIADNLAVVALGWTAAGLALHQLLTFHRDRHAALVVAHKKFLVCRLADLFLVVSLALVHHNVQGFGFDDIAAWVRVHPDLNPQMQAAAVCVVFAVVLRSAQLPFHGWLIQVMEAPTPVSALLHAGVVNIGGFVLIRLSPWMARAEFAQLLLVVFGLTSAILAALIMTTRVSIKVALAWSTCAQMGFMLVQCGLGLWHLAMLHLVAHSLYKAHAFLSAGTTVDGWRVQFLTTLSPPSSNARLAVAVVLAWAIGATAVFVGDLAGVERGASVPLALMVSLSLVPLLTHIVDGTARRAALAIRIVGVLLLYIGWHAAAANVMPTSTSAPSIVAVALVIVAFLGLFVVKATLQQRPHGRLARRLAPALFAGFYIDERFTRLAFWLWPPPQRRRAHSLRPGRSQTVIEVGT